MQIISTKGKKILWLCSICRWTQGQVLSRLEILGIVCVDRNALSLWWAFTRGFTFVGLHIVDLQSAFLGVNSPLQNCRERNDPLKDVAITSTSLAEAARALILLPLACCCLILFHCTSQSNILNVCQGQKGLDWLVALGYAVVHEIHSRPYQSWCLPSWTVQLEYHYFIRRLTVNSETFESHKHAVCSHVYPTLSEDSVYQPTTAKGSGYSTGTLYHSWVPDFKVGV